LKSASLQYANAFADIAIRRGAPQTAVRRLADFGASFAESGELRNFLASPAVNIADKHGVIEKIIARQAELESAIIRQPSFLASVDEPVEAQYGETETQRSSAREFDEIDAAIDAAVVDSVAAPDFMTGAEVRREAKSDVSRKNILRPEAKIIRNFLFVIIDHHRSQMLPEIIAAVESVVRQRQGIAEAEVSSAVELTSAQKTELARTLSRLTGKKIEPKYSLDPALLGGAVARVGDTIYDGSLRSRLTEMRARLSEE
jgi:F-type H+-transporting ATPase subunit delta